MSLITPHLYLGNASNANDHAFLASKKISLIINCAKEIPNFFEKEKHIKYIRLELNDVPNQSLDKALHIASDAILNNIKKGLTTFVHCAAGISRSASVVIYTIMRMHNWSFEKSYRFVKDMHPNTHPNPGFVEQLIKTQSGKHNSIDLKSSESGEETHETRVLTDGPNIAYGAIHPEKPAEPTTSLTLDNDHVRPAYVRNAKGTYAKIFSGSK